MGLLIMDNFFKNDYNYKVLERYTQSWIGTPYRHLTIVKGRGADCGLFICGVLKDFGLMKDLSYEFYPSGWEVNARTECILDMMVDSFKNSVVNKKIIIEKMTPEVGLDRGDILTFSTGKNGITNHAAYYMEDGNLIHSLEKIGVHSIMMPSFFKNRITYVFRLMEKQ